MLNKRLQRLNALAAAKPALTEVCRFYTALYQLFADADPFLQAEVDLAAAGPRQQQGFPLISSEMLRFDAAAAEKFFAQLLQILHQHGQQGQTELKLLQDAFEAGKLELCPLLSAVFERDREPISSTATAVGIQPALLEYVLATALGAGLQRCVEQGLKSEIQHWDHGYCPVCGGLPAIAELSGEEGKKKLQCGQCGNSWGFHRMTCTHCGNTEHDSLGYFTTEGEPGYRVDICRKCSGYLKVVDSREKGADLPLEIEDVATLHLDLLAAREGFSRGKKETLDA
ncbi:formate dehydrogenase accessory protein FdhE [Geopsychrobacter electrodiphilus]|uniref:formate dehydrogenase accessory protein FdhE n=1 Tax=Geopsychrobacter electrodiphilus TaxID=225196 RepID=UPI000379D095|nr:formate dehydrogenase accessory protein FdhE [Geopsychrobacter electrodiphilus]